METAIMELSNGVEETMHAAWRSGNFARVTEMMLASYGPELHGFVLAQFSGQAARGEDAFHDFCEDFWRGIPSFEWRCSLRAWSYKLARSAAARAHHSPHERRHRRLSLVDGPEIAALVVAARTSTELYMRTAAKDAVRELRARLSPEDRELLTLRVDRRLSWGEVAHVLADEDAAGSEAGLARFGAALRQRFGEVKKRLRRLAVEAGLL
jgi:RNA polymerase sigma-70 factor, ECF subfamily